MGPHAFSEGNWPPQAYINRLQSPSEKVCGSIMCQLWEVTNYRNPVYQNCTKKGQGSSLQMTNGKWVCMESFRSSKVHPMQIIITDSSLQYWAASPQMNKGKQSLEGIPIAMGEEHPRRWFQYRIRFLSGTSGKSPLPIRNGRSSLGKVQGIFLTWVTRSNKRQNMHR